MRLELLILLSYIVVHTNEWQSEKTNTFKEKHNSDEIYARMITLMQTLHLEGRARHASLNTIRFMYEKTPYYELGYIMGEIIERYRKMVNHARRRHLWASSTVHLLVRKVQLIQALYFEIYHLCGMMHEIEIKYRDKMQFRDIYKETPMIEIEKEQQEIAFALEEKRKKKAAEERQKQKKLKQMRKNASAYREYKKNLVMTTRKNFWPLEYGWDIGPDW